MKFSETIVVYDIKVGRCSQLNEDMNFLNVKGQGHSLTFVEGHLDSTFSNFISLKTARPTEAKFNVEPPWDGSEYKWFVTGLNWPPCPYIVKTFKNFLF